MADAFTHNDAKALLNGKHVLFIGDSNTRAQYKDMVWLLTSNTLISQQCLRRKLELSYLGDELVEKSELDHGRSFKEVRRMNFKKTNTVVEFMFISRCWNEQLETFFDNIRKKTCKVPDVLVMNSCVWDINRWGPNGVPEYKKNMVGLMRMMKQIIPPDCLMIWTTALPAGPQVRGGLLIKQVECMEPMVRFDIMEANKFAREVVVNHGFDVLDYHFYLRMQMHRRAKDGLHYMSIPVRLMTNLLLTHIALSWGKELPNNVNTALLNKAIAETSKMPLDSVSNIPSTGNFSKMNLISPIVRKCRGLKVTFNPGEEITSRRCRLGQEPGNNYNDREFMQPRQHLRRTLDFRQGSHQGPYRQRNENKWRRRKNMPYYNQRFM